MKNIDIESYIDLHQLLEQDSTTRESNRSFGLKHKDILSSPIALLEQWTKDHRYRLTTPLLSEKISKLISSATLILLAIALIAGIFSGVALLRYSGNQPVNLLYFLGAVLLLPLMTIMMALFAMLRANRTSSALVHISPAYWMEKIFIFFVDKEQNRDSAIWINPLIANWIVIKRSQELALAFSTGLFLALIGIVTSEDIAFAWSSTLNISPEELHSFFSMIAFAWSSFLPQAVPSIELIEQSHYFRLGGHLSTQMTQNASMLGGWWKFLAMTTLTYALFLRFLLFLLAGVGLKNAISRATLLISGARELLREIQEPLIDSNAYTTEEGFEQDMKIDGLRAVALEGHYESAIGWAVDEQTILLQNERKLIKADSIYEAGGLHTLQEDQYVLGSISGDILLYVKSWEPPTLDFIDFLVELSQQNVNLVSLYLLGTPESGDRPTQANIDIWMREIGSLNKQNIVVAKE